MNNKNSQQSSRETERQIDGEEVKEDIKVREQGGETKCWNKLRKQPFIEHEPYKGGHGDTRVMDQIGTCRKLNRRK